jgi:hypothetical protein
VTAVRRAGTRRSGDPGSAGSSRSGDPGSSGDSWAGRRPSPAEAGLLDLARSLAASEPGPAALDRALGLLDEAFGPDASLPRLLAETWLHTRGDKTAALALGWAREQVRRALADVVMGVRPEDPRAAAAVSPDFAAWLLLAAAEGESREVGGTVSDRLRAVCALLALP